MALFDLLVALAPPAAVSAAGLFCWARSSRSLGAARGRATAGFVDGTALETFLDVGVDLLAVTDRQGRLVRVSRSWFEVLGYEPADVLGTQVADLVHPDDVTRVLEAHARARSQRCRGRARFRARDGRYRVLEWTARFRGAFVYSVARDVTAIDRQAREADALQTRLRLFVEHTPAAVAMLDRAMRYQVVSRGWYEQYGLPAEHDLVGRSHYDVFPTIPERWRELHRRALAGETLEAERDEFVREGGRSDWLRWRLEPWRDADGEIGGLIMFTEVITERVEREEQLAAARDRAESANTAKSEFLANMSHEIRTPMTAILGFLELVDPRDPEQTHSAMETVRTNADHLLSVINGLLDMSKIEAGRMEVESIQIDPVRVAEESLAIVRPKAEAKDLELTLEYATSIPEYVHSDATRVRQILVNLLGNAIKFTESGSVRLRLAFEPAEHGAATPGLLRFEVVDTGVGMHAEQLERIRRFEAFQQADTSMSRRYGGTGLGLRISAHLARLLGGELEVTSRLGRGTTMTASVAAPVTSGVRMLAPEQAETLREMRGLVREAQRQVAQRLRGRRVLVVDDGADNRRLLGHHLKREGAEVVLATNGLEAIQKIEDEHVDDFDVVLMDMQMPKMDGYEAVRWIRAVGRMLPILALTAHALSEDRQKCLDSGCTDYLTKPIRRETLVEAIERALVADTASRA